MSGARIKGTNPLNKNGTISRCAICDSTCHWAKSCPHKSESVNITSELKQECNPAEQLEEVNIILFVEMNAVEVFLVEAMGTAVIDTARTCTVCGERWLDNYLKTLDELSLKKVKRNPSSIGFRFGDGGRINSFKTATIPAEIAGVKCQIITEVIKKDIPLLLSKASLKKAGACLDLKNDKALMFGQEIQLQLTSSGHYCVDIKSAKDFERKPYLLSSHEVLMINDEMNPSEKKKKLVKLHKQFGHSSFE